MYLFILVMMNRAKMVMLMTVTWSMSIWLPMLRWEMLEAITGCHSKSATPCKDIMIRIMMTMLLELLVIMMTMMMVTLCNVQDPPPSPVWTISLQFPSAF